jgi:hypothetical protein
VLVAAAFVFQPLEPHPVWLAALLLSFRTVWLLLSAEGFERCIFILGVTHRICESAKYKPAKNEGCLYMFLRLWFNDADGSPG